MACAGDPAQMRGINAMISVQAITSEIIVEPTLSRSIVSAGSLEAAADMVTLLIFWKAL